MRNFQSCIEVTMTRLPSCTSRKTSLDKLTEILLRTTIQEPSKQPTVESPDASGERTGNRMVTFDLRGDRKAANGVHCQSPFRREFFRPVVYVFTTPHPAHPFFISLFILWLGQSDSQRLV